MTTRKISSLLILFLASLTNAARLSYNLPGEAALNVQPDATASGLIDVAGFDPPAQFVFQDGLEDRRTIRNTVREDPYTLTAPKYYPDGDPKCSPPTEDPDGLWPGKGCVCFEPTVNEMSYYNMTDARDATNQQTGYRTAFDTSQTGGVTVAGWWQAGDTSGEPWNAQPGHPGQQTSLLFIRGEKSSWDSGFNLGMGNWGGFSFEVVLKAPEGQRPHRITVGSPTNWYPGIQVWHYVVGTYDAEAGRASLYVDNELIAHKEAPLDWVNTDRTTRDIKWNGEAQTALSRVGNGFDSNDKNFRGCTGGFAVYGGVPCFEVTTCEEIYTLLGDFQTSSLNICASSAPISCRAKRKQDTQLDFDGRHIRLKCISNKGLAQERCLMDLTPDENYQYLANTDVYTHSVIKLRGQSSLVMEGFELYGHQAKYGILYALEGSNFVCRGCIFRDNVAQGGNGFGRGLIVRDHNPTCDGGIPLGNIVFEACLFQLNIGELIYLEGSLLTLKDSVFYNNEAMPEEKGGFIVFSGKSVDEFDHDVSNNVFKDNDGTNAGIHSRWFSRGMPARCKALLSDWSTDALCNSLLVNADNCASGNLNPKEVQGTSNDCVDGVWLKWPMNQCVALNECDAATPTLNDIYPIAGSTEIKQYLVRKSPTSCSSDTASSYGDPHFKTWGGFQFDFHGECDLWLMQNPGFMNGLGMGLSIRTKGKTWYSYIESAALRIGNDTIEVMGGFALEEGKPKYWINGVPGEALNDGEFAASTVGGFQVTFHQLPYKNSFRLDLGPAGAISFETAKHFVRANVHAKDPSNFTSCTGLMGSYAEGGEMLARNGKVMDDPNEFGKEWQVRANEPQLFHTTDGAIQHPEQCQMPSSQMASRLRRRLIASDALEEATRACAHVPSTYRQDCISDVVATNDVSLAEIY